MTHLGKLLAVMVITATLSGCRGMMPMGGMDMGGMHNMGNMDMGMRERCMGSQMRDATAHKEANDLSVAFTTVPERPRMGANVLRVNLTESRSGKPIENAEVAFRFTMMMPGMLVREEKATRTSDGVYEAKADLNMEGRWEIFVEIKQPGQPTRGEKFTVIVS